ncbi:FkbM family methyltransferase [bacterium]|jgi:FkbM family methyltransferase|nr:FkbM family methyltransferase [bacterium]MBT4251261.1 FkbM family methyltransferase [bacterium]MBT4598358.1 FkbM family methyltransferase [bacterium]MBT6754191.1 FkbM family methyltransferase [bacterium]MBT7038038.1 FkbM family methyltransferase [bacterium]
MRKIFYKIPKLGKIVKQRDSALNMIKDLELRERRLLENKEKMNCFKDIFLSPWTDKWKIFYVNKNNEIDKYISQLKSGLDKESKLVVDNLWEKIIFLIPYNKHKKSFLYKVEDFFTKKELIEQKKNIDLSRYNIPNGVNIEKPVFLNKNGLAFLPKRILLKIKGKIIVDGGAYFGDSALVFLEYTPSRVYSFEPVNLTYKKLKETIRINKMGDIVTPIKLGLGKKAGKAFIKGTNSAASLTTSDFKNAQEISITSIDDFFSGKNDVIGLIKLDVEGEELGVIKGALETIKRDKPILLISVYHRPEDFFFIKPLIDDLNLGYKFMIRKTSSFRVTSETVLIGYSG